MATKAPTLEQKKLEQEIRKLAAEADVAELKRAELARKNERFWRDQERV